MKKYSKFLSIILTVSLCVMLSVIFLGCADSDIPADNKGTDTTISIEERAKIESEKARSKESKSFAAEYIADVVSQNIADCSWNSNTHIYSGRATKSPNNEYNGWIFSLVTDEVKTGYLQLIYHNEKWYVTEYSFEGESLLGDPKESDGTVVYIGNSEYYIAIHDHNFSNSTAYSHYVSEENFSYEDISAKYEEFLGTIK